VRTCHIIERLACYTIGSLYDAECDVLQAKKNMEPNV